MKLTVNKIFNCWLILTTLLLYPPYSIAENACDCEDPPGGRIKCEDHQVAFCRIKEGKVDGECKNPPESAKTKNELGAWVLSELLQMPIRPENVNQRFEYQKILSEGRYTNPRTGEIIRFSIPRRR